MRVPFIFREPSVEDARVDEDHFSMSCFRTEYLSRATPGLSSLGRGVELEDLFAYGAQGLVEAAARFDGAKGIPFAAFARHRIRGAIFDGISTEHWLGRRAYRRLQSGLTPGDVQLVQIAELVETAGDARWNGPPEHRLGAGRPIDLRNHIDGSPLGGAR